MIINLEAKLSGLEPVTREDLFELVNSWGRSDGFITYDNIDINKSKQCECYDLSNLDVSKIDNLSYVFRDSYYNGDLSKWDLSNVLTIESLFEYSIFNNDSISNWDVSNVKNMSGLFYCCPFNQNLSNWDVSKVNNMDRMFSYSNFDKDLSSWNLNPFLSCNYMFNKNSSFENKYNSGKEFSLFSKDIINWLKENGNKMKEINQGTKEEVLDFFSFDNKNLEIK